MGLGIKLFLYLERGLNLSLEADRWGFKTSFIISGYLYHVFWELGEADLVCIWQIAETTVGDTTLTQNPNLLTPRRFSLCSILCCLGLNDLKEARWISTCCVGHITIGTLSRRRFWAQRWFLDGVPLTNQQCLPKSQEMKMPHICIQSLNGPPNVKKV